jgi:hypothetical protein
MSTDPQASGGFHFVNYLQKSLLFAVLVALVLVVTGRWLIPTTSFVSVAAAAASLIGYGGIAAWGPAWLDRRHPAILRGAITFGLLAGAIFAGEIVLEYILLPANNSVFGQVEYGVVFGLYFAAAFVTALRTRSVNNAVLTAAASAFIASLIWVISVLAVFYVFRGSTRQEQVLRAEGDYEDFARGGMSDFNAFIMEDFMGATFFHLLLGPLAAAVLGVLGGLLGKAIARFQKRRIGQSR